MKKLLPLGFSLTASLSSPARPSQSGEKTEHLPSRRRHNRLAETSEIHFASSARVELLHSASAFRPNKQP
jgi:hypothetical protein